MSKVTIATVWLDGCSGCHMSFLDQDERLIDLAPLIELVYSPLVDNKEFPEMVDVTLVEGAVSSDEDLHKIRKIRARTKILVSLGDCAVTANVPSMRNSFKVADILKRAYEENADLNAGTMPSGQVPTLLKHARPVHEIVNVDIFVPGCPPHADTINYVLTELLAGRKPDMTGRTRFGI
ncbi:MAG: NADP oxidoreductase [bacterium]|nr:NADP oxidoreductase [Candidatus Sumerlaeota bacterium]